MNIELLHADITMIHVDIVLFLYEHFCILCQEIKDALLLLVNSKNVECMKYYLHIGYDICYNEK